MKSIIKIFLILLIGLITFSCANRQERENRKYQKSLNLVRGDTDKFRDACMIAFPSVPTKYIKGETIVKVDTITIPGETILVDCDKQELKEIKCPSNKIIEKVIEKTDTIYKQDQKVISGYESKLKNQKEDFLKEKEDLQKDKDQLKRNSDYYQNLYEAKQLAYDKLNSENADLKSSKQKGWSWFYGLLAVLTIGFIARFYFKR